MSFFPFNRETQRQITELEQQLSQLNEQQLQINSEAKMSNVSKSLAGDIISKSMHLKHTFMLNAEGPFCFCLSSIG